MFARWFQRCNCFQLFLLFLSYGKTKLTKERGIWMRNIGLSYFFFRFKFWQFVKLSLCICLCLLGVLNSFSAFPAVAAPSIPTLSDKEVITYLDNLKAQAFATTNAGQFEAAIANWSELIDYFPEKAELWSNRGNVYAAQNKMDLAIADYNKAIDLAPYAADPWINRGIAWEVLKEWDKAIADYNEALKLEPDDFVAHNNRGNAQAGKGNWYGAIADYNQATILNPSFSMAKANYALAVYQVGQQEQGINLMRRLARRYPKFADIRAALTAALWKQGKAGEAESNWFAVEGLDGRYKDIDWVENARRWPPSLVESLRSFLLLE